MQVVYSELQFGDAMQKIYLLDSNGMTFMAEAPIEELAAVIYGVSMANKTVKVILRGVHDYAIKIAEDLINKGLTVEIK